MPVLQPSVSSVPGIRRRVAPQAVLAAAAVFAVAIALAVIALVDGGGPAPSTTPTRAADHGTSIVKGARGGAFGDVPGAKGAGALRE